MSLVIRRCDVEEILKASNIIELLEEYAVESAISGLPKPAHKAELYRQFTAADIMECFAAFLDDLLIGFITVLSPVMPHYSIPVSVTESFFVAKEHRKTGAGLKLLHFVEKCMQEKGAQGLLVSAPYGGSLAEVLPKIGYKETNRVFFRGFNER